MLYRDTMTHQSCFFLDIYRIARSESRLPNVVKRRWRNNGPKADDFTFGDHACAGMGHAHPKA